ncbi:MAG: Ca-activated chloride channel [Blastocatellia bacterium]|jgi:Ca-activated chloride channel family protein|nr:Ca-activated chloride channel [Blastocatellia bacterium]
MAAIQNSMRNLRGLALLCGALAFLLFTLSASAQQPSPPPPPVGTAPASEKPVGGIKPPMAKPTPAEDEEAGEIIRVTSNLVVAPVSVTDATGQPVLGLTVPDFHLEEEGRAQEITQIGDPEQVPLDIALLFDISLSVESRFDFEKEAASRFLKQVMKPGDRATIFTIGTHSKLELPLDTAERASAKVMSINPVKEATAFYDTVVEAARYLAQNTPGSHRRVIVVISDGEDTYSDKIKAAIGATPQERDSIKAEDRLKIYNRVLLEVQRETQKAEVAFYSINPSGEALKLNIISKRAQEGMEQLAAATGGTSFIPEKIDNLDAVFRQIAAELRSQYLLQYYSNSESAGDKFLRIKVSVPARPQVRIRARQGYYPKRK